MSHRKICYVLLLFCLSSCFHKSNETGTADNVRHSIICHTANGDFLITHEEIFHATSKSSKNGISFTTGYAEYRYTARDIRSGTQAVRLVTGDMEKDFIPLGYDGTNLWCYSADKGLGLHARTPSTLQVSIKQQQIEQANAALAGKLSAPKLTDADRYYMFDCLSGKVVATDLQGYVYTIDPANLKAATITKMPEAPRLYHATASSGDLWEDRHVSLGGDLRRQIKLPSGDKSNETFLEGAFITERDANKLGAKGQGAMETRRGEMLQVRREYDSMLKAYPVLKDERQAYQTIKDYHIPSNFSDLKRSLNRKIQDSADMTQSIVRHLSNVLAGDSNTVYIVHANDVTDTTAMLISKVSIHNNACKTEWTTLVTGIYFNPTKGIKKNPMKEVFKAGNPKFDYQWFGLQGDVLAGINMLFAFGIDTHTGKLLWKQQL
jgi:hypothetical protein